MYLSLIKRGVFCAPSFCHVFVNCVILSKSATVVHILAKEICQIKIPIHMEDTKKTFKGTLIQV